MLLQDCVRQQYLNGTMEKRFPGPYCKEINLSSEQLNSTDTIEPLNHDCVKNGVVFEIKNICKTSTEVVTILKHIQPALFEPANIAAVNIAARKKFVSKTKVKGYKSETKRILIH